MSEYNLSKEEEKIAFIKIFFVSMIFSAVMGFCMYYFVNWYYFIEEKLNMKDFIFLISVIFSVMIFIIMILLSSIIGRNFLKKRAGKSLTKYQIFTDTLINADSDGDAFNNFLEYLIDIYPKTRINIYYKDGKRKQDNWVKISNVKLPVCNFKCNTCPVSSKGEEMKINSISKDIVCSFQLDDYKDGSYVCLKMKSNKTIYGVLQIYSPTPRFFTEEVIKDLRSYIDNVLHSVVNKNLVENLNKEAYTDRLTGVHNRKFFDEVFTKILDKTIKSNLETSLLFIDIDNFKKVNDDYGHQAGDKILIAFSKIIQTCLRKNDLLSRYGGEEFTVILPLTGCEDSEDIANRIREVVEQETMASLNGIELPSITCSIGVSTFPSIAKSGEELLKTADLATYEAKNAGRNCVKVFSPVK